MAVVRVSVLLAAWLLVAPLAAQQSGPLLALPPAPKHLSLATRASGTTARPGGKVDLFVDVTPNPGIHVYAPGAKGYTPIAITLGAQTDVKLTETVYPTSEVLVFAPLNEKVPVYEKAFRLTRTMTVGASVKAGTTVTVAGTVDYQACDDKVCFVPASAPVAWTVRVE